MSEMPKHLKVWEAIVLAACAFFLTGIINGLFVLKLFGDLGGLLVDILMVCVWVKLWKMARRPTT